MKYLLGDVMLDAGLEVVEHLVEDSFGLVLVVLWLSRVIMKEIPFGGCHA